MLDHTLKSDVTARRLEVITETGRRRLVSGFEPRLALVALDRIIAIQIFDRHQCVMLFASLHAGLVLPTMPRHRSVALDVLDQALGLLRKKFGEISFLRSFSE